ncbi:MAG: hypothetical protein E6Q89_03550 [Bacteroidia bacterium]|nr:MAG: hypothetical protein E6Q89_03550 [Bacteroidia bacterium]
MINCFISMKAKWGFYTLLLVLFLTACKVQQQVPQYLENATNDSINKTAVYPDLTIQKGDQLAIQVYSDYLSAKPGSIDADFNQPTPTSGATANGESVNTTSISGGYLVDINGNIEYPRLGIIKAEGFTKAQLAVEIKKRLTQPVELLKNPTVLIRFQSFKVSTVGELASPKVLSVPTEKITIWEAISMSGGLTEWAKKDHIRIIREQNGVREIGTINLASANPFASPYYYLKQGDVIVVDAMPEKAKIKDEQTSYARVSFITGLVATLSTIATLVISLSRSK